MATTPGDVEALATRTANVYADAETLLLQKLAEYTAKGVASPAWLSNELATIQKFRSVASGIADDAAAQVLGGVVAEGQDAVAYGYQSAAREIGERIASQVPGKSPHAVVALASQMQKATSSATFAINASVQPAIHDVIVSALNAPLLGVETPETAAQRVLNKLADQGISKVAYAGGRVVRVEHYVEMGMRTGLMNAAMEGHTLKCQAAGIDLVQVSDVPQECAKCRPFEGKVLALSSSTRPGKVQMTGVGGKTVTVNVTATLAQARAEGLFHPNCRHVYRAFIAGASEEKFADTTADPDGDALRQRQRSLERALREARRREAVAITPEAKAAAKALVKTRRDRLTAHITDNDLKRVRARESITGQFKPVKGSTAAAPPDLVGPKTQLTGSFAPKAPEVGKKTQLTGSFAPKPPADPNPYGKTQLTGSFAPKLADAKIVAGPSKAKAPPVKLGKPKTPPPAPPAPPKPPAAPKGKRPPPGVLDASAEVGTSDNPRRFTSAAAGRAYGSKLTAGPVKWNGAQLKAIRTYTGSAYRRINSALIRSNGKTGGLKHLDAAFTSPQAKAIDEWIVTTRGASLKELGVSDIKTAAGQVNTQPGYWSTSMKTKPAFGGEVQLFIRQPPGTRGLFVDGRPPLSVNPGEMEWLLPRGTKYRIVETRAGTNGFLHNVVVEVIP